MSVAKKVVFAIVLMIVTFALVYPVTFVILHYIIGLEDFKSSKVATICYLLAFFAALYFWVLRVGRSE
jgi:hypothetical protein